MGDDELDQRELGEEAAEAEQRKDPGYPREQVRYLARLAAGGDRVAVGHLLGWLELHPGLRSLVRDLDDLAARTERAWADRLAPAGGLARKAVEEELAALKADLLGPAPSALDTVLAGTVVVAHLDFQRAAREAARPADQPEVRAAREKLLGAAQRWLQDAARGWRLLAGAEARADGRRGVREAVQAGPGVTAVPPAPRPRRRTMGPSTIQKVAFAGSPGGPPPDGRGPGGQRVLVMAGPADRGDELSSGPSSAAS